MSHLTICDMLATIELRAQKKPSSNEGNEASVTPQLNHFGCDVGPFVAEAVRDLSQKDLSGNENVLS